jgi:hypothetical protein
VTKKTSKIELPENIQRQVDRNVAARELRERLITELRKCADTVRASLLKDAGVEVTDYMLAEVHEYLREEYRNAGRALRKHLAQGT